MPAEGVGPQCASSREGLGAQVRDLGVGGVGAAAGAAAGADAGVAVVRRDAIGGLGK